ncbi:MAG: hypothetical protein HZA04_10830 [Nitrospinae bacterium]|nr:hypothetical protein [Nitrospinota bacterium]
MLGTLGISANTAFSAIYAPEQIPTPTSPYLGLFGIGFRTKGTTMESMMGIFSSLTNTRECDTELYDKLKSIREKRRVETVEKGDILPSSTFYYREPANSFDRRRWMDSAINIVKECHLVFLDPDNGIECPSMQKSKEGKYAFWKEIETLYNGKHSLVIYHHLGRNSTHEDQIKNLQQKLATKLGRAGSPPAIRAFRYRRGTSRAFFIVLHPNNPFSDQMGEQVDSFRKPNWFDNNHFTFIDKTET